MLCMVLKPQSATVSQTLLASMSHPCRLRATAAAQLAEFSSPAGVTPEDREAAADKGMGVPQEMGEAKDKGISAVRQGMQGHNKEAVTRRVRTGRVVLPSKVMLLSRSATMHEGEIGTRAMATMARRP